jgi:cytoskeletal protein CcmA (bactofilin family)
MADEAGRDDRETCIGKGCQLEGKLTVKGNLRVDGRVNGQIDVAGLLVIGLGAQVNADVLAGTLRVEGELNGDQRATSQIALTPSARVRGSLESPALAIERGALFEGTCKMHFERPASSPAPVSPGGARR